MDRNDIVEFLIASVAQVYRVDPSTLSEDTNLPEELGVKSMLQLALCGLIENETDVVFSVGDFGKYPTIGAIADYIDEKML
ncbi:MAG: acyl carrier protein [Agathobacter sp.]|nr:acyl carrier protein [Agathobacter sp.]